MSLSDLASLGSFVSGFAVLVSLIFLYFQLRQLGRQVIQAEKNQQASIRQGRTGRSVEINIAGTDPMVAEALTKAVSGAQDITGTQLQQYSMFCRALFYNYEDIFYQKQDGLLTDPAFSDFVATLRQALRLPSFRVQWKRWRTSYGAGFAEFMDKLIAGTPVEPPPSFGPAEWLTALAAEMSGAPS